MLFDRGHAKDVLLLGVRFSTSYRFEVIDPKVHRSYRKMFFLEKSADPLTEKCQKFATKGFTGTRTHAKFRGNR